MLEQLKAEERASEAGCSRTLAGIVTGIMAAQAVSTGAWQFIIGAGLTAGYILYCTDRCNRARQEEVALSATPELTQAVAERYFRKHLGMMSTLLENYNNAYKHNK